MGECKYNSYTEPIETMQSNVSIKFENCFIKGKESIGGGVKDIEFRNCAFDGGQICDESQELIRGGENIYFENCFFKERLIAGGRKIKLRNCVIINELDSLINRTYTNRNKLIHVSEEVVFDNCFIRSKMKLVWYDGGDIGKPEPMMIIKNSYFDDYSCIVKKEYD